MREKFYIFCGVNSKDKSILSRFKSPFVVFRVTGTSQDALPSDKEMNEISRVCSSIVFPGPIKLGLAGPKKTVDLGEYMRSKMASIVYVDEGVELFWFANQIDIKNKKFVEIEVKGTELTLVKYLLSEIELISEEDVVESSS